MLRIGGDTEGTWKGTVDGAESREGRRERDPGHVWRKSSAWPLFVCYRRIFNTPTEARK